MAAPDLQVPQTHALELVRSVLCPNAVWKSGQANQRIRKGALVCMTSVRAAAGHRPIRERENDPKSLKARAIPPLNNRSHHRNRKREHF